MGLLHFYCSPDFSPLLCRSASNSFTVQSASGELVQLWVILECFGLVGGIVGGSGNRLESQSQLACGYCG